MLTTDGTNIKQLGKNAARWLFHGSQTNTNTYWWMVCLDYNFKKIAITSQSMTPIRWQWRVSDDHHAYWINWFLSPLPDSCALYRHTDTRLMASFQDNLSKVARER